MAKRKRVPQPAAFQQGDCLAVDLDDGTWTAALVLGVVDASNGDGCPIVAGLDWRGKGKPRIEVFRETSLFRDGYREPDLNRYPGGPYDGNFPVEVVGRIEVDLARFPLRNDEENGWQMTESFGDPVEPGEEAPVGHTGWSSVGFAMSCQEEERPDLPDSIEWDDGELQTRRALSSADCARLNAYLETHPESSLRLYSLTGKAKPRLANLDELPALRSLELEFNAGEMIDLAPLANLPADLQSLSLSTIAPGGDRKNDKPKKNLAVLQRLTRLRELKLFGQLDVVEFVRPMTTLHSLEIHRAKLKSLAGIDALTDLEELRLVASGAKDLGPLAALHQLRRITLENQRNMASLQPISRLPRLRRLLLSASSAEAGMPSFAGLPELRIAIVDKLAGPADLARIGEAPGLRILVISNAPEFASIEALRPLQGHPTLQQVWLECGNARTKKAISAAYGWKVEYCNFADEDDLIDS